MLDPMENSLFDLPDYDNTEDETFAAFPPPASPGGEHGGGQMANGMEDWDGNQRSPPAEEPAKPVRKTVKRNIPRLDAQRLVSERGLPALRTMFDNAKFKGKGHEAEDVKLLLRQMEHWAHRLYPKLGFEDFISKLEVLGTKKPIQTCLKRIRMDMPILHDDFTTPEEVEAERQSNGLNMPTEDFEVNPPTEDSEPLSESWSRIVASQPPSHTSPFLSEEQRLRMERNRQLALEKRMAKIQNSSQTQASSPPATPVPTFAEVKKSDAQDLDGLGDDMDIEFLDALVAAAAETETAVMEGADSKADVDALVGDNTNSALAAADGNTAHTAAADSETALAVDVASDVTVKEGAKTALVEDRRVLEAAETPAMEDAATDMETSEASGAAASETDIATLDVEAAVNKATADLKTPAADTETFVVEDAAASLKKAGADTSVAEDAANPSVNSVMSDRGTATAAVTEAAMNAGDASDSAAARSDAAGPPCAVDTISNDENYQNVAEAPADLNPAPGDTAAEAIAVFRIRENDAPNGEKGLSLENTECND